jgi:hypothetical protein
MSNYEEIEIHQSNTYLSLKWQKVINDGIDVSEKTKHKS